jgi:hypothetical protein
MMRRVWLSIAVVVLVAACRPITPASTPLASSAAFPPELSAAATAGIPTVGELVASPAFDTCRAPTTAQMSVWRSSPYRSVGVYIGGNSAACPPGINNPNFNSSWVNTVVGVQGWRLHPIWVGPQAPCTGYTHRIGYDPLDATYEAWLQANAAAAAASSFGIGPATTGKLGSPIYYDLEAYPRDGGPCTEAVQYFVNEWVVRLHELGYQAGFYSSGASGITDVVAAKNAGTLSVPDDLWFARWNGIANTDGKPYVPDHLWTHRRHHQYLGGHNETYGPLNNRVMLNIDSSMSDGLVAQRAFYRSQDWPLPSKQR